jgi:RNA polymerase sigma factor (sigma-70 family)
MKKEFAKDTLITRMRKGSEKAFEEFVKLFGPKIFSLAENKGIIGKDAKDITQDILADIFIRVRDLEPEEEKKLSIFPDFSEWIMKKANDALLDKLRKSGGIKKHIVAGESAEKILESIPAPPARELSYFLLLDGVITKALNALSPKERKVLLDVLEGTGYKQIAAEMGVREEASRRTYVRALTILAEAIPRVIKKEIKKGRKQYTPMEIECLEEISERLQEDINKRRNMGKVKR